MESPPAAAWLIVVVELLLLQSRTDGQQSYVNNHQLDCYNDSWNSTTKGYLCNGVKPSCQAYLTFRSNPNYNQPVTISYLLGTSQSDATLIASLNNISSDMASIPTDTLLLVPVNCSCSGDYYQHNATYVLKHLSETYFTVANDTYQGLSTCQAMMSQNPYADKNLTVGLQLSVPLRCACPTFNQSATGFKYLLTYMVTWKDSVSSIANLFGADEHSIRDANKLQSDLIFPFTPLLVPLTTEPTMIEAAVPPSPPPQQPPQIPVGQSTSTSSNKKWVYIGVGVGAGFLILAAVSGFLVWFYRHQKSDSDQEKPVSVLPPKMLSESTDYTAIPETKSWSASLSSQGLRYAIESLTLYKFDDLQMATGYFGEDNRIKGSVYRGWFKGDVAAVKVMKGDVSSEINLLKTINHSNIVRLSGFCVHEGSTYLVYEYADNGSLSDWLQLKKNQTQVALAWKQRVQVAYDVADALNYLHNYTNPPYIHKNLKTSNILLDGNFRGKLANFGLARMVENDDQGLQLTRHVVGTYGYLAPEYVENGVITPKLDVFAFGVVMLEVLSGKEATAGDRNAGEEFLSAEIIRVLEGDNVREKLHGFIDPSLRHEYPLDLAFSMAQLAKLCVAKDLNTRPAMPEVMITLSKILSSSLDWDPSDELDNSTSMSIGR